MLMFVAAPDPGRMLVRLPGAAACGATGYGLAALCRVMKPVGRSMTSMPGERHWIALILSGCSFILPSRRCPVFWIFMRWEAGKRQGPANRDRTVEIVCGVSQKVDTSIGPLCTVRPKTYRVAHA